MESTKVKTKNGGTILVPKFASVEEATKEYGKVEVLKKLNRMIRVDLVNKANVKQSVQARLKTLIKTSPEAKKQYEALLKKHNIK